MLNETSFDLGQTNQEIDDMARHKPGPYILDIPYIVTGLLHHLTINCDAIGTPAVGSNPTDVEMETKNGEGILLSGAANEFWGVARDLLHSSTLASTYTLWKANENNNEKTFVSGGTLTEPNGTANFGPTLTSQVTMTWRSARGNYGRIQIMEGYPTGTNQLPLLSTSFPEITALSAYVLGGTSIVMARDRSFFVQAMNASFEPQNDQIFERRYRS